MKEIIDEYDPEYCHSLEAVYGKGMMSEGGGVAIDAMFKGLSIHGKKALDIGAGLGGVAYHLAKKYAMWKSPVWRSTPGCAKRQLVERLPTSKTTSLCTEHRQRSFAL